MSVDEAVASAPPIVATTITLEAIQDALHDQGFPIERKLINLLYCDMFSYCTTALTCILKFHLLSCLVHLITKL